MNKMLLCIFCLCMLTTSHLLTENNDEERLHTFTSLDQVNTYHDLENFEKALALVNEVLSQKLTPHEQGWALLKKGTILSRMKIDEEALALYDVILKSFADSDTSGVLKSSVYYEKSKSLARMHDFAAAIDAAREAIELTKQANFTSFNKEFRIEQISIRLARYLILAGMPVDGVEYMQKTIVNLKSLLSDKNSDSFQRNIFCELSVAYKELIDMYVSLNEKQLAIESCENALFYSIKRNPCFLEHPWTLQLQKRLKELNE